MFETFAVARGRRVRRAVVALAVVAVATALAPIGWAQSDHSTVIRVLRSSRDFRARTRAALALGSSNDRTVVPQLIGALRDDHPAVRAAAATGLVCTTR